MPCVWLCCTHEPLSDYMVPVEIQIDYRLIILMVPTQKEELVSTKFIPYTHAPTNNKYMIKE